MMKTTTTFGALDHPFLGVVEQVFDNSLSHAGPRDIAQGLKRLAISLKNDDTSMLHYCLGPTPLESKRVALTACVMAHVSKSVRSTKLLDTSFTSFFRQQLDAFQKRSMDDDKEEEGDGDGDGDDDPILHDDSWKEGLQTLGWVRPGGLLRHVLEQAVETSILTHVRQTIESDYETPMYESLTEWKQAVLCPWMESLNFDHDSGGKAKKFVDTAVAKSFVQVRLEEIFDLVAEFPDSMVAIQELQMVLHTFAELQHEFLHGSSSGNHPKKVAHALRETLIRRLCHPGANTLQIIDMYINTIKVLRILDPTDQLLTRVAEPVRCYLQGRPDTVRCIIASLTNAEQGGDLYEELKRQDAKPLEDVTLDSDDEGDLPPDYLNPHHLWQPPPSIHQTHPSFLAESGTGGGKNAADILAMLVSIYGSKELFVNEYRLMLADKLLSNSAQDYNTDQQVHTLELLKLRFGDMSMRACEIMLKDINDSKRTNINIRSFLEDNVVDAIMISHIFWPSLQQQRDSTSLKHHPRLQYQLDQFGREYARLKNPRKLEWLYPLGSVQLELDVIEGNQVTTKTFDCSPPLASLIMHFSDQPEWTAEDLSNETNIPVHTIQKQMMFWINHRVVKTIVCDAAGVITYALAGTQTADPHSAAAARAHAAAQHHLLTDHEDDDDLLSGSAVSFNAYKEEEMSVFTSYIVGMLTNLGQLPLKTIHNNLKTFVTGSDVKYSKTPQQLSAFLQHLCRQEILECGPDGMYKILKKA